MIELTNSIEQAVAVGDSVAFDTVTTKSGCAEYHRNGSKTVRLLRPGRYMVSFSGNISASTSAGAITMAIATDGEALAPATMEVTAPSADAFFNVFAQTYIEVPQCCGKTCCVDVTVENTSTQAVAVTNANLMAVRVCG